ncbi:MAG: NAD-dependent epimerase/dehydratase family protein [Nitrospirae bacterium]|nr:NAD-dependent epimerase/dehydratase family protein [Nitrospirota bacterium]
MKALVTGATGFIGSYLAEALIKRGYEVTCLVRGTSNPRWIEDLTIDYICCDLSDIESCAAQISDFDYVFHVAGITKAVTDEEFFAANAFCTRKLLQVVAGRNPSMKRFVYLSSLAAVGPSVDGRPVCEETQPSPVSFYGRSKLEGEKAVLEYAERMPVTVIRPPAVYGPRDTDLLVMFKLIQKGIFPFWGECSYSLLYVEDLIRGVIMAAESMEAEGRTFFLSDDMVYTNEEIVGAISLALGRKALKIRMPLSIMPFIAFLGEKMHKRGIINMDKVRELRFSNWTCSSEKAKKELGFRPNTTLMEGIKWTADWYRIHRWI